MPPELIATVLACAGIVIGVWKMVDGVRRELRDSKPSTSIQRAEDGTP